MKVLLANDQSAMAKETVELVTRFPFVDPVDLIFVSVIALPDIPPSIKALKDWPTVIKTLEKTAEDKNLDAGHNLQHPPSSVISIVRRGDPAEQILKVADNEQPDLIALGALGHSTFDRMVLGSVSDRVATHATCSTLVARPTGLATDATRKPKIMIAYDGSEPSRKALEEIIALDWQQDATFTLVRAVIMFDHYYYGIAAGAVIEQDQLEEIEADLDEAASELRDRGLNVKTEIRQTSHVGDEICQRAKELGSDIIVVGSHGYTGLKKFLLGSTSQYVLRHAKCSVWISR